MFGLLLKCSLVELKDKDVFSDVNTYELLSIPIFLILKKKALLIIKYLLGNEQDKIEILVWGWHVDLKFYKLLRILHMVDKKRF